MKRHPTRPWLTLAGLVVLVPACLDEAYDFTAVEQQLTRPHTELTYLKDEAERYVFLHGINVSGSTKVPTTAPSLEAPDTPLTYIGKPFPLEDADRWLQQLNDLGFNSMRLLMMWEAVMPGCPPDAPAGCRDDTYIDAAYVAYIGEVVRLARDHNIYVLMDMHQDIFSRHLTVRYNEDPATSVREAIDVEIPKGGLEETILSLLPPYTDTVQGDGAPRWVVQACMPEKNMDSPNWGMPRLLGDLKGNPAAIASLVDVYTELMADEGGAFTIPPWLQYFMANVPDPYPVTDTSDFLPWTFWGIDVALSVDTGRCFACLFAGDKAFPGLTGPDGQTDIKTYLQDAYARAWTAIAEEVGGEPNIIGYDIINEPVGVFILLSVATAVFELGLDQDGLEAFLAGLVGDALADDLARVIVALRLVPPTVDDPAEAAELRRQWGLEHADLFAILGLNYGLDENYLQPFHAKMGQAIQQVDPDAVIWIEPSGSVEALLGGGGLPQWELNMTRPEGLNQVVFAPHWYPDIYPYLGFNQKPRDFKIDEIRFRDYTEGLEGARRRAWYSLGNVPVVFGEFGTYFNLRTPIEQPDGTVELVSQVETGVYDLSSHILDNYYENFEALFQSRMLWCFSPENDAHYGDLWNKEDFSVIGPPDANDQRKPRGERAFARPHVRALSGKPISTHFYSDYHYFDPHRFVVDPQREFELRFQSKETNAPTVVFTAEQVQYPEGFYVWLSDGYAIYDAERQLLYFYPTVETPGHEHWVRLLPPLPGQQMTGWNYFFRGADAVSGK